MRGPFVLAFLAAAMVIWQAASRLMPPTEPPAPTVASEDVAAVAGAPASPPPEAVESAEPWGVKVRPILTAAAFAYTRNHPAAPLSAKSFAALANSEQPGVLAFAPIDEPDPIVMQLRTPSRDSLCSAIVAAARANDLPIPFFANLIWQESSFRSKTVSPAGALGIAQFIPETAIEHGLMNPFEPVHALFASGKLLRKLYDKFGNLGLAAAAYNAGPQ